MHITKMHKIIGTPCTLRHQGNSCRKGNMPFPPKYLPYMKANTKFVVISKWTTIMSQRNAGPFFEFFDHLVKVIIMIRAYVPP